jgi:hypothetical protein
MNALIVLITIIFISLCGYVLLRGFNLVSKKDNLLAVAYSYGFGTSLIALQLYLYSRLSIAWDRENILLPWIVIFIIIIFKRKKDISFKFPEIPPIKTVDKIIIAGICISLSYVILEALIRPLTTWDGWANWLFQAKVFFLQGRILPEDLIYMNSEYPLTINLLGTFIYIILGRVDDTAVLLTSSAFYAFIALLMFAVLKKNYGVRYALLFTLLLTTTQNFIRHGGRLEAGMADLPLGYFAFISATLLIDYLQKNSTRTFILLNIFLAMTALIKFEGIPLSFFIALCAIYHIYKTKKYGHIPIFFIWILPPVLWQIDRRLLELSHEYFSSGHYLETSFEKTITAFTGTLKELINIKSWNLLWIIFFYMLFIKPKNLKHFNTLPFIILSQLSLYVIMYLLTSGHAPDSSIERLLMHIAPIAFYYIAVKIKHLKLSDNFNKMIFINNS